MTKPKSKTRSASRSNGSKTTGPTHANRRKAAKPEPDKQPPARKDIGSKARQTVRIESKQSRVIAMLRLPNGATIEAIMLTTKWQQHSVRGFLAGVVRKQFGLNLVSEASESGRVYRIKDRKPPPVAGAKSIQVA
jgi:hypothetical protein